MKQFPHRSTLRLTRAGFLAMVALVGVSAQAASTQVGVSVNVSQPGFYGRIDIGQQPPQVIYPQPVIIEQGRYEQRPIYLRVPPGHSKDWKRYCGVYRACGQPVYFVRDEPSRGRDDRHDHDHGDRDDDRRGERGDRGKGRGHGHGHGHD